MQKAFEFKWMHEPITNTCFGFSLRDASYDTAANICGQQNSGQLAKVTDETINTHIRAQIAKHSAKETLPTWVSGKCMYVFKYHWETHLKKFALALI